ncbi:MAG: metalloregulator ArsR/SmtB family transcription factor [Alphaproteobacteria bacterium]
MDEFLIKLRAVAEPTRLRLLVLCAHGELTVSEITRILGQSQPRVSRHLKLLVEAGLLRRLQEGTSAFYRLAAGANGSGNGSADELVRRLVELLPADDATLALDRERLDAIKLARAERAAAYFRSNAAHWDKLRKLYVDESEVETRLIKLLPLAPAAQLLDVGTGTGRILEIFGDKVTHALGIDLSREMLAVARANLERSGLANCEVRHGDMYKLPVPTASFDAVTFHQVLHFADDPGAALKEAARVLRPGARLVIVDFAPHQLESLRSEHAHRRLGFANDEVAGWCRAAGLELVESEDLPGDSLTVMLWAADRADGPKDRAPGRFATRIGA